MKSLRSLICGQWVSGLAGVGLLEVTFLLELTLAVNSQISILLSCTTSYVGGRHNMPPPLQVGI